MQPLYKLHDCNLMDIILLCTRGTTERIKNIRNAILRIYWLTKRKCSVEKNVKCCFKYLLVIAKGFCSYWFSLQLQFYTICSCSISNKLHDKKNLFFLGSIWGLFGSFKPQARKKMVLQTFKLNQKFISVDEGWKTLFFVCKSWRHWDSIDIDFLGYKVNQNFLKFKWSFGSIYFWSILFFKS